MQDMQEMTYDRAVEAKVYDLTRRALYSDDPDEVSRIIRELEGIAQSTGNPLPVQEAVFLWESGKINIDRIIMFLEDCYKFSNSTELRDEVMKWTFQLLWIVSNPSFWIVTDPSF